MAFVSADPEAQTVETSAQETIIFSRCRPGDLDADPFEVMISFRCGDAAAFVCADVVSRGKTGERG
jgi:hypothetical protein